MVVSLDFQKNGSKMQWRIQASPTHALIFGGLELAWRCLVVWNPMGCFQGPKMERILTCKWILLGIQVGYIFFWYWNDKKPLSSQRHLTIMESCHRFAKSFCERYPHFSNIAYANATPSGSQHKRRLLHLFFLSESLSPENSVDFGLAENGEFPSFQKLAEYLRRRWTGGPGLLKGALEQLSTSLISARGVGSWWRVRWEVYDDKINDSWTCSRKRER